MSEPVFSTRISIQWETDPSPHEPTNTWVFTAGNGEFVDTRINTLTNAPEWMVNGYEKLIATEKGYECSIKFVSDLDGSKSLDEQTDGGSDIGHFKSIPNSFDRLEEGSMVNPECGEKLAYKEVWRTLDPLKSTPDLLVAKLEKKEQQKETTTQGSTEDSTSNQVWKLSNELGRFIVIGDFAQGIAVDEKENFHVLRMYKNQIIYKYGDNIETVFAPFINVDSSDSKWTRTFTSEQS